MYLGLDSYRLVIDLALLSADALALRSELF